VLCGGRLACAEKLAIFVCGGGLACEEGVEEKLAILGVSSFPDSSICATSAIEGNLRARGFVGFKVVLVAAVGEVAAGNFEEKEVFVVELVFVVGWDDGGEDEVW